MNLIEQLGGYVNAKEFINGECSDGFDVQGLRDALLEYRRANNIFETGDDVVIPSRGNGIFKVSRLLCRSDIREMQHATDSEIAKGKRDEND